MWKTTNYKGETVTWYSEEDIKPFLDPYFNGLDFKTIAELAKKSIRITAYNCELEHKIEDVIEACNSLKYENEEYIKIDEVLSILK
jgi:Leu/Phe-tRNA-protein transferase